MDFKSVLWIDSASRAEAPGPPEGASDLRLDLIVDAITEPKREYNLKPLFWSPLRDVEAVRYRQEVFRDLENGALLEAVRAFAEEMRRVRRYLTLAEQLDFPYHKKGWVLEAALVYGEAVQELARALEEAPLRARGLLAFREYLQRYTGSPRFRALVEEGRQVKRALEEIQYGVIIEPGKFKVKRYEGEAEYSPEIESTFAKFRQDVPTGKARELAMKLPERGGMSHIEAKILEFVARLYPEPFAALDRFCEGHVPFLDETVRAFDREVQFYVAYLDFIADLRRQGLPFCYPEVSTTTKETDVRDGFDLALAHTRRSDLSERPIVLNDFALRGPERVLIVTGPNQGGKTTFARMVGQIHYLAGLGCPVPAREARLFLPDRIFTHFERREDIRNLRGKLEDDLVRIRGMLARATPNSLFVLNEIFASTGVQDALFLSREILTRLLELDALGVWVTFLDELASFSEKTVSMVAQVDPDDPAKRTFRVVRRPADGLAYALALARKHGLTYEQLKGRLSR